MLKRIIISIIIVGIIILIHTNLNWRKVDIKMTNNEEYITPPKVDAIASITPHADGGPTVPPESPAAPAPSKLTRPWIRTVLTRDVYVAGHSRPHPELCPALGARLKLAILVTSAPSHRRARDAIRLTWGHFAARSDVALAFVLGAPPDSLRAAIDAEDALYGDIVVGRSLDSYSNLTLKTLSMLEWMDSYCPRAPRLLKTDDDMFINVPKLFEFAAEPKRANATLTIWGRVDRRSFPHRDKTSLYYVPRKEFPWQVYPDFTTGPAYLMTSDVIRPLLAAAPRHPYLRLEDVFITGVLGELLGIKRRSAREFYNRRVPPRRCILRKAISIHMVRYHEQFALWRKLMDGKSVYCRKRFRYTWCPTMSNSTCGGNSSVPERDRDAFSAINELIQ